MLRIKTVLSGDIRMFRFDGNSTDYFDSLLEFVRTVYQLKQPFKLQYIDEEQDKVTIVSTQDLMDALECANEAKQTLKVFVTVNTPNVMNNEKKGKEQKAPSMDRSDVVEKSAKKTSDYVTQNCCEDQKTEQCVSDCTLEDKHTDEDFRADIVGDGHSLSDGSHVETNQQFTKIWVVKNTGKREWLDGTKVKYCGRKKQSIGRSTRISDQYTRETG